MLFFSFFDIFFSSGQGHIIISQPERQFVTVAFFEHLIQLVREAAMELVRMLVPVVGRVEIGLMIDTP